MNRSFSSFAKGIGTGIVAGITITATGAMLLNGSSKNARSAKKKIGHAFETVGGICENISMMIK